MSFNSKTLAIYGDTAAQTRGKVEMHTARECVSPMRECIWSTPPSARLELNRWARYRPCTAQHNIGAGNPFAIADSVTDHRAAPTPTHHPHHRERNDDPAPNNSALFLTQLASSVTIVHRRDRLRASKTMATRAVANPKIRFAWNQQVTEITGAGRVEGLELVDTMTGARSHLVVSGVFVAIGHRPNNDLVDGQLDLAAHGYIATKPGSSETNLAGVFACGDVQDHTYRQAITAAGSGCQAAIDAERWLEATRHA